MGGAIEDVVVVASSAVLYEGVHSKATLIIILYFYAKSMLANNHIVLRSQLVGAILVHFALEVLGAAEVDQPLAHPTD